MMSSRLPHGQLDEPPAAITLGEFCQVSRQSGSRLAVTDAAKRIPIKVLMLSHSRKLVNFAPAHATISAAFSTELSRSTVVAYTAIVSRRAEAQSRRVSTQTSATLRLCAMRRLQRSVNSVPLCFNVTISPISRMPSSILLRDFLQQSRCFLGQFGKFLPTWIIFRQLG